MYIYIYILLLHITLITATSTVTRAELRIGPEEIARDAATEVFQEP